MNKKLISSLMATALVLPMLVGCGNTASTTNSTNESKVEATTPVEETAKVEEVATEEGKVFNIYCWNEEFKSRMASHYPTYEEVDATTGKIGDVTVNWIITPNDNNAYQNALDEALLLQADASTDKKIDLFLIESDYALKYVDTEYTLDVINDLGISEDQLSEQYQYTKDIVTDSNGNLKGVSWQGCPGAMIYRRDVAKQVYGTDEPAAIQEKFSDWDKFLAEGEVLKGAGYQLTSSVNDTYRVFSNNVSSKWVVDGKINIDENIMKWVEMSKTMKDAGYTQTHDMWADDWSKGFTTAGNVFCYFGPAWFIDFTLGGHDLDGQWAMTTGPQSFYWGGTWICGATGTDNPSLVKDIIETLTCDKDTMVNIVKADNDFVNNKSAMEEMAADTTYTNAVLGGQNPLKMFCEGAEQIDLSNLSPYDLGCTEEFQNAMKNYYLGTATLDEALDLFYKNVEIKYPDIHR
ncbi:MAG: carbohydrate ABC transporter substrate-binding protein [Cellulosilyticum sp.]|nr:carbohydrate ABC transporter substrate-binding protein [Cellulosilyticum sp.]